MSTENSPVPVNDNLVLLCGKSACGKSASLMGLENPEGVISLNCEAGKKLPFKSKFKQLIIEHKKATLIALFFLIGCRIDFFVGCEFARRGFTVPFHQDRGKISDCANWHRDSLGKGLEMVGRSVE